MNKITLAGLKLSSFLLVISILLYLTPINSFAATTAKEYYQQGCNYYEQKKFDEAAKSFEKAVELKPDNAIYHYNLGTTYCNLGKYEEALKHLKKVVELTPKSQAGKYAKETLEELKKQFPNLTYSEKENETNEEPKSTPKETISYAGDRDVVNIALCHPDIHKRMEVAKILVKIGPSILECLDDAMEDKRVYCSPAQDIGPLFPLVQQKNVPVYGMSSAGLVEIGRVLVNDISRFTAANIATRGAAVGGISDTMVREGAKRVEEIVEIVLKGLGKENVYSVVENKNFHKHLRKVAVHLLSTNFIKEIKKDDKILQDLQLLTDDKNELMSTRGDAAYILNTVSGEKVFELSFLTKDLKTFHTKKEFDELKKSESELELEKDRIKNEVIDKIIESCKITIGKKLIGKTVHIIPTSTIYGKDGSSGIWGMPSSSPGYRVYRTCSYEGIDMKWIDKAIEMPEVRGFLWSYVYPFSYLYPPSVTVARILDFTSEGKVICEEIKNGRKFVFDPIDKEKMLLDPSCLKNIGLILDHRTSEDCSKLIEIIEPMKKEHKKRIEKIQNENKRIEREVDSLIKAEEINWDKFLGKRVKLYVCKYSIHKKFVDHIPLIIVSFGSVFEDTS